MSFGNRHLCRRRWRSISAEEFLSREKKFGRAENRYGTSNGSGSSSNEIKKIKEISEKIKGTEKAVILDSDLNEIKSVSAKALSGTLKKIDEKIYCIVIDGAVTSIIIKSAEELDVKIIAGKNFSTTDTEIKLVGV